MRKRYYYTLSPADLATNLDYNTNDRGQSTATISSAKLSCQAATRHTQPIYTIAVLEGTMILCVCVSASCSVNIEISLLVCLSVTGHMYRVILTFAYLNSGKPQGEKQRANGAVSRE